MGFKKNAPPSRLIFHSMSDPFIDFVSLQKTYIDKGFTEQNWYDAWRSDVLQSPTDTTLFPVLSGKKLASFYMRMPTGEDMLFVRDEAMRYTRPGNEYYRRHEAAENTFLFRSCLVRATNVFDDPDSPQVFDDDVRGEGEVKGRLSDVIADLPLHVQGNVGMLFKKAIEVATEKQGK